MPRILIVESLKNWICTIRDNYRLLKCGMTNIVLGLDRPPQ